MKEKRKHGILAKRLTALAVVVCLLFGMVPSGLTMFEPFEVEAANGVQQKIDAIKAIYPTGSFFSVNRQACTHGSYETCPNSNCQLSEVMKKHHGGWPGGTDGWTCMAFARFVFYQVFGVMCSNTSGGWYNVSISNAKVGDFVVIDGGSHYGIYLYSDGGYFYLYESNINYMPNKVGYGTIKYANSRATEVRRANNYDSVNNTSSTPTGSVTTPTISTDLPSYIANETAKISWAKSSTNCDFYQYWLVVQNLTENKQIFSGATGNAGDVNANSANIKFGSAGEYKITVYAVPYDKTKQKVRSFFHIF